MININFEKAPVGGKISVQTRNNRYTFAHGPEGWTIQGGQWEEPTAINNPFSAGSVIWFETASDRHRWHTSEIMGIYPS
jgi:hypothetical protein